jgi:hypothetical protein
MKTIITDPNLNQEIASLGDQAKHDKLVNEPAKAQEEARTTVIDASDRVPQFEQANGVSVKGPDKQVYTDADRVAISARQVTDIKRKRGTGGKMGQAWS